MGKNRFTASAAKKVLRLLGGEDMPSSSLPEWLSSELEAEGLIIAKTHGSRTSYHVMDADACDKFIRNEYIGDTSLERWIEVMENKDGCIGRSDLVRESGDSKSVSIRTFRGFLVNCCEPIEAEIHGESFTLSPMDGTAVFIQDTDSFKIPDDTVVVGMENGENFRYVRRQRKLFDYPSVLFVSRYPQSADLRQWLCGIHNRYIHFGDFDLAGINIYNTEFYRYLGNRASFFIPGDIEDRLRNGNKDLYDRQYDRFKHMDVADKRLEPLVNMINHYHRVYEQEGYIESV